MQELMINAQAGALDGNFEEIKTMLASQLEAYKTLVFTEDTKKDAKNTVAELRKDKKALEDRVKEVKKEWMKPFDDFNSKAFELYRLYDEPIVYINAQLEEFEAKRKAEKQEHIKELYEELVEPEMQEFVPLAKIYNPKWENATASDKAIKDEIMHLKLMVKDSLATIKSLQTDVEEQAISMYLQNYILSDVLTFITKYENDKRMILEREKERAKQEERERIRAEERAKIEAEQAKAAEVQAAREEAIEAYIPAADGEVKKHTYILSLTDDAKRKLDMFLDSVGIEFEELVF